MENQKRKSIPFIGAFENLKQMREQMFKLGDYSFDCGECNGYVAIPPEHPLYGMPYEDVDEKLGYPVHGGLTFGEPMLDFIFNIDAIAVGKAGEIKDIKDYYVYGFDTMHFGDTLAEWSKERVVKEALTLKEAFDNYE